MRKLLLLWATCAIGTPALAQTPARDLVKQGGQLYDEGHYDQALAKYQQALAAEPTLQVAQAELARTYNALGRHAEAKATCEQLLKRTPNAGPTLYAAYGNSLDGLGQAKQAELAYRAGRKKYPDSYGLYYNLGVVQAGQQQYAAAITSFQQAALRNPDYASSHMSAGLLQLAMGQRVPGVLALARFLVLEPTGPRAAHCLPLLDQALLPGASQPGAPDTSVALPLTALLKSKKPDDFGPEEFMLSLADTRKFTPDEKSAHKTKLENYIARFYNVCEVIALMSEQSAKPNKGFVSRYYVPYFAAMGLNGYVPTFIYLAHSTELDAQTWLAAHPNEVQVFQEWSKNYKWPKQ